MTDKKITLILGPTGIGKSSLAHQEALKNKGIILSSDAYQIYRGMTIGTAKPSDKQLSEVPYHFINIKDPDESFSVAEFLSQTNKLIDTHKTDDTPIYICGGTGYYLHNLMYQTSFTPDISSKKEIRDKYVHWPPEKLWNTLHELDPQRASEIPKNNTQRLIRALEIHEISGELPSSYKHTTPTLRQDMEVIGLTTERTTLYTRINNRVDNMIAEGLIDEVKLLLQKYPEDTASFKAIGYHETIHYLKGRCTKSEMIECIKKRTRNFAKRQLTWFRRYTHVNWSIIN